jgi:cytochrome c biogenesis protein CcdA
MALLVVFALIAGGGTALSPCVLPVLPALLAAGATGGRRRPFGIVTGLALSFTFATVALVYVIEALGLPDDLVRNLAIAVLIAFGLSLLLPPLGDRIEAAISRVAPAPRRLGGEGLGSGLAIGASLGLVYAPCAGPILAGVITVSASQDFTAGKLAVALAYAIGSATVLYALLLGGRSLAARLAGFRGHVHVAMGAVMVAVGGLMLVVALGELGLVRRILPHVHAAAPAAPAGGPGPFSGGPGGGAAPGAGGGGPFGGGRPGGAPGRGGP